MPHFILMNLSIFILLGVGACILIFLGNKLDDQSSISAFLGFTLIFMLGLVILPGAPGSIEYKTGELHQTNNVTGDVTITDQYTSYNSVTYGLYIMLLAMFMIINEVMALRGFNNV